MTNLKRLELSGFKSFARSTALEFPASIAGVVGPNGSGKSNISESVRWVLGEQSMKSLRGKRGEDLIWNGSNTMPRMGKASVTLVFDNKKRNIPVDFEEVSITRKIFRDGLNEYYLNGSQVRLKDIVELIARMGLGDIKHNMIGQGEVDRILMSATPRERRELIEEAIGLKVYHIKKAEAERKLHASAENLKNVESLIRELTPHLKFLKEQAKKAESRQVYIEELKALERHYFKKGFDEIKKAFQRTELEKTPLEKKIKELETGIQEMFGMIRGLEGKARDSEEVREIRAGIGALEGEERSISRELGRTEGRLEAEKAKPKTVTRIIDLDYVKDAVLRFVKLVREAEEEIDREAQKKKVTGLRNHLEAFLHNMEKGSIEEDAAANKEIEELAKAEQKLQEQMQRVVTRLKEAKEALYGKEKDYRKLQEELRNLDRTIREREEEKTMAREALNRILFEEEKIKLREEELEKEFQMLGVSRDILEGPLEESEILGNEQDMRRKIERLRAKLEEVGGIDDSVIKEYQETETRYVFLQKELEDTKNAILSLEELIGTLTKTLKENFEEGFASIKEEFHNYFRVIFGGGRAMLKMVEYGRRREPEDVEGLDELAEEEKREEGIDIEVDLPKKRIKNLAMLSGGEKALTSIAFLFAIVAVNPPPFLFLDETDAALDEANSKRYAEILKELAKKTQLIVVTHNRETMRVAGVLYGVTMGDDGVSKLLSLKLEEAEAYTNR
ncbi:MAG: AAA family ATPase [Candidatus Sungbacteria bacterium]|nr:AAA family ATPase [Candidatus Sungbacteria bacterium]